MLDNRSAQLSGVSIDAASSYLWDTRRPLNVSDSALSPYMQILPKEHDGPTEMLFCTVRTEIGDCIRQIQVLEKSAKVTHSTCVSSKLQLIDECESNIDQGVLSKLDPSIPLHLFTTYLARSAFCQMRLSAGHPRHYPDKGASMAQSQKNVLVRLALEVVAYDSLTHSTPSLQGYLWHVGLHFPFQALVLVLTELLTGASMGDATERAWVCVGRAYEDHPEFIDEALKNQLYFALGNLTIKAWTRRVEGTLGNEGDLYSRSMAAIFSKLQAQRISKPPKMAPGMAPPQPAAACMAVAPPGGGGVKEAISQAEPSGIGFAEGSQQSLFFNS